MILLFLLTLSHFGLQNYANLFKYARNMKILAALFTFFSKKTADSRIK